MLKSKWGDEGFYMKGAMTSAWYNVSEPRKDGSGCNPASVGFGTVWDIWLCLGQHQWQPYVWCLKSECCEEKGLLQGSINEDNVI